MMTSAERPYLVKGVNPAGRIVEVAILATDLDDAKRKAEEVGLRYVVVGGVAPCPPEPDPKGSTA